MKIKRTLLMIVVFAMSFFGTQVANAEEEQVTSTQEQLTPNQVQDISKTYSFFTKNEGQMEDEEIKYSANLTSGQALITDKGIAYDFILEQPEQNAEESLIEGENIENQEPVKKLAIKESFWGNGEKLSFDIQTEEQDRSETKISSFIGNDESQWKSNIETYKTIYLGELWDNIQVSLNAKESNVEKVFRVNPKGNPENIQIKLKGAENLTIDENTQELIVHTNSQITPEIRFTKPFAFQEINNEKVAVYVAYKIQKIGEDYFYGFETGEYNRDYPLVIDPLIAGTYLGGTGSDLFLYGSTSPVVDSSDSIFVATYSTSNDYPVTAGAYDITDNHATQGELIVSKFNNNLTTLQASTYLGAITVTYGYGLILDGSDNVYLTGQPYSSAFPVTAGAFDTAYTSTDGFVSILSNDLSILRYSTFNRGCYYSTSVDVDAMNNVFVLCPGVGNTYFVPMVGAYDTTHNGSGDFGIVKFNSDLSSMLAATYVGGSGSESSIGRSIKVDSNGSVYVVGSTNSSNFPTTVGAYDTVFGGATDLVVFKLNNDLAQLDASTYLGGSGEEYYFDSNSTGSIDVNNASVLVSLSRVTSADYPTTAGAFDASRGGVEDSVISKLDSNLANLQASTYLCDGFKTYGGAKFDYMGDIVTVGSGTDTSCITAGAYDAIASGSDVMISKFSSDLTTLRAGTFIGGVLTDVGCGFSFDSSHNIVGIAGYSQGSFPVTSGAYDTTFNAGTYDNVIFTINPDLLLVSNSLPTNISLSASSINEAQASGTTIGALTTTDADGGDTHTTTVQNPRFFNQSEGF